ncbi:MAG: 3-phosphoshikimate 1-carboxyvinyltransferase [Propionibacteriaceae bacterium]|nr:3-phosphoshikimate 1-carboxyvinyltransferase [Propionibacteriaceae bacterium]
MGWAAPTSGPLRARVELPGSKSAAARALVLAALATGPSTLSGLPTGRDTALMLNALSALGADITASGNTAVVTPGDLQAASVDCGLSGTVMRFLPPLAAIGARPVRFHGDTQAHARPMGPLLGALRTLGAQVDSDSLPFSVLGPVTRGEAVVDSSASSQFISGLLLSAARYPEGLHLMHRGGPLPSRPHIDMTLLLLQARGVCAENDGNTWFVAPGDIAPVTERIEPDLTATATFLAAALVAGGSVTAPWPAPATAVSLAGGAPRWIQPAADLLDALQAFGARVQQRDGEVTISGDLQPAPWLDLGAISEFTPAAAALAALADGPSEITGVGHIRGHETDRLAALEAGINALGGRVSQTENGLRIEPAKLHGGVFAVRADHRLAHAAALLGLAVPGVVIDDIAATSKTIPDFPERWAAMVRAS